MVGWGFDPSQRIFAIWVLDYIQYYTIAPMRHPAVVQGIWAAAKADTLSLTAWQIGMYGFMAVAPF